MHQWIDEFLIPGLAGPLVVTDPLIIANDAWDRVEALEARVNGLERRLARLAMLATKERKRS